MNSKINKEKVMKPLRDNMSIDEYFAEGFAKCIYAESLEPDDKAWVANQYWGIVDASPHVFEFWQKCDNNGRYIGDSFSHFEYVGVKYAHVPKEIGLHYKMTGSATILVKIQLVHPILRERKLFIFELGRETGYTLYDKISSYIQLEQKYDKKPGLFHQLVLNRMIRKNMNR